MADAKKCDRCGAFYTKCKPIKMGETQLSLSVSNSYSTRLFDLCPECVDKLNQYLNDGWEEQK